MTDPVTKNIGWLFSDKLLTLGLSFVSGVLVARILGPESFGVWSYALSVSLILGVFVTFGAENVGIAEVSRSPNKQLEISSYFTIRILGGLACLFLSCITIPFLGITEQIKNGIFILLFGNLFLAFDTADYFYQAKQKTKFGVWIRLASH